MIRRGRSNAFWMSDGGVARVLVSEDILLPPELSVGSEGRGFFTVIR